MSERLALILVVAAPPDAVFVASLGGAVEPLIHTPKPIQSACVSRIGVVNDAVFERERAHARPLAYVRVHVGSAHGGELTGSVGRRARRYRGNRLLALVVVVDSLALFLFRERGAEIGIEIAVGRRRTEKETAPRSLECI